MQSNAGKTGGTIKSLLVEHQQIRQNQGQIGKNALAPPRWPKNPNIFLTSSLWRTFTRSTAKILLQ
jgi:hypothetical protein